MLRIESDSLGMLELVPGAWLYIKRLHEGETYLDLSTGEYTHIEEVMKRCVQEVSAAFTRLSNELES